MTTPARILVALAVLAALAAPHLAAPTRAHADLCTACAEPDVPEVMLHALPAVVRHAEGSRHHEQTSLGA